MIDESWALAMRSKRMPSREEAEILGLKALAFLAGDAARLTRFLDLTGLSAEALRQNASEPSMLSAVLEHLAGDESLLLVFSAETSLPPDAIGSALHALAQAEGS